MKSFKILLYIILIGNSIHAEGLKPTLANGNITNHYAVRIYYNTEELRLNIVTTFEPLDMNKQEHYIVAEVDEEEHQKLLNLELNVTVDANYTERLNHVLPVSIKAKTVNAQGYPTIPNYSCYRTVEGTFSTAENIVRQYPSLAQWIDVGDSWKKENGLGGYDMKVLKITSRAYARPKPALFITSSIHAREYAPAELATRFAEYLVSHYGTDADITWMLDYHEVHLMLMANPDGRKKAEAGHYWRKNANNNYCAGGNRKGADLNRNFNFKWDCCGGSSNYECSQTYHGSAAASEPETQAIQRYMLNLFGDHRANDLSTPAPLNTSGIYLDIHSYSELILWPWGTSGTTAPNNMVSLGRKFAYTNHYTPKQSYGLYATDGTTNDYGYGELGIPSYTFELGTRFFQDCNTFNQTIVPDNMPSLLYALKAVRTPYTLSMGPEIKNISLNASSETFQGTLVTLTARADDTLYNNSHGTEPTQNIVQAEYYIDTPPWVTGAHAISMRTSDNTFNSPSEIITQTINTSTLSIGKHTIFVRAKDANNNWGTISAVFLTITHNPHPVPTAPSNLNVSHINKNSAILRWRDNSNNERGFKIYKGNALVKTVGANIHVATVTGLSANTTYTYTVKAYNNSGLSAGISKRFKTQAKTTTILSIPFNTNTNGSWNAQTISTHKNGRYAKFYSFTLKQRTKVIINLSSNKDTYLYLLQGKNKNGKKITYDDDGGAGFNSRITRTLAAGTYTIEATTYQKATTGAFMLKVSTNHNHNDSIPTIPFNVNKSDTWDAYTTSTHKNGRYAKFYTFTLTHSTQVTINLSSSKDTYLYLLQGNSKNGSKITYNDDGGAGLNSRITRTLAAGTYTIEATTYRKATRGAFVLSVSK